MTADVVETATAARTYTVPAAVVASITNALSDPKLAEHPDAGLARTLATGKATVDDAIRVAEPADPLGDKLRGGTGGRLWADRIVASVMREMDREESATRDRFAYDPDTFAYVGITSDENEDLITQLVRFPREDSNLDRSEALTASGWLRAEFDFTGEDAHTYGVALDSSMFAFVASALTSDDVTGVLLAYGEPITFLPEAPLLASVADVHPSEDGDVYAVVDSNDTTAVMDVIMIAPGPVVYRRNAGEWEPDQAMLEAFYTATPPPIVELVGSTKEQLISQMDEKAANELVDTGAGLVVGDTETKGGVKGGSKPGNDVGAGTRNRVSGDKTPGKAGTEVPQLPGAPNPPEGRDKRTPEDAEEGPNSKPPVTASAVRDSYHRSLAAIAKMHQRELDAAARHYYSDEGYAEGFNLTAAIAAADARALGRQKALRTRALVAAGRDLQVARARATELENVVLPALTAASTNKPGQHNKPGQRRAESLRKYWVHGEGAMKIRWGTPGDFGRCVRQLRKYLGARTEGYCALRHKESTGMWTGEKRHLKKSSG